MDDDKTNLLLELKYSGMLKKLYRHGIIRPHVFLMVESRIKVRALMNSGLTKAESVRLLASELGKNVKHVYTYLQ